MILIKNAEVYSPKKIGNKDIIISFDKILKISDDRYNYDFTEVYDAKGKIIVPGFIDQHVHITGGGGEGGFMTRVPESSFSELVKGGLTTVVGLLGTDSVTRSIENLIAKVNTLNFEGITAYALTGAYCYPSTTLTGSVEKDITFIDPIIGVKIAANDHRDSAITFKEYAKIGAKARLAGMLSNKSGHVTVHMGNGKFDLEQINKALDISNIPITVFRPTHINRKFSLFKQAIEYAKKGGYIDATSQMGEGDLSDVNVFKIAKKENILSNLSFSTDGYGSWSRYDKEGNLLEIGYSPVDSSIKSFKDIVKSGENIEDVLPLYTSNLAKQMKLKNKGKIEEKMDADLLILDSDLTLSSVIAKGKWLMKDKKILKKGTYE